MATAAPDGDEDGEPAETGAQIAARLEWQATAVAVAVLAMAAALVGSLAWPLVAPALQALTGSGAEGPLPLHHRWHAPARVRRETWDAARGNLADWVAATRADEPVVLAATPASKWRAVRRWGPAYLAEHAAGLNVSTVLGAHTVFQYWNHEMAGWAAPALEACAGRWRRCILPSPGGTLAPEPLAMAEFWRRAAGAGAGTAPLLYGSAKLGPADFDSELLRDDLRGAAAWLGPSPVTAAPATIKWQLWLGGGNVTSQTHYDEDANVHTVLHGTKRFLLGRPTAAHAAHLFPRVHGCRRHSMVEFEPGAAAQPGLTFTFEAAELADGPVEVVEAVLRPGEAIYIPPFWLHRVESREQAVAVSVWWAGPHSVVIAALKRQIEATADLIDAAWPLPTRAALLKLQLDALAPPGWGALPRLLAQRYRPLYGPEADGVEDFVGWCTPGALLDAQERAGAAARRALDAAAAESKRLLGQLEDPAVRLTVLQDEAELLLGSELGVGRIHAFLLGCYGQR